MASVSPGFSTSIVTSASGYEWRNVNWQQARLRFDAGPGVRGDDELEKLIAFFRARRGPAVGFRFRDPYDFSSNGMTGTPTAADQLLGTGDGLTADFPLVKTYGAKAPVQTRRITRPDFATLLVSVDGAVQAGNWSLLAGGIVRFANPPAAGASVRAGFLFDVPVRFAQDSLDVSATTFAAGEAPSVPVLEIREAA